jgi:hypothetical protein
MSSANHIERIAERNVAASARDFTSDPSGPSNGPQFFHGTLHKLGNAIDDFMLCLPAVKFPPCVSILMLVTSSSAFALPAFPGAVGHGADVTGGRSGSVYHVPDRFAPQSARRIASLFSTSVAISR